MPFEEAIDWVSAALFMVSATVALLAYYLWLNRLYKSGKIGGTDQWTGSAFDAASVAPRLQQVRKDYLAAQSSRPRPHPPGLLKVAAEAVARLSYFCRPKSEPEAESSKQAIALAPE